MIVWPRGWVLIILGRAGGRRRLFEEIRYFFSETVLFLGFNLTKSSLERIVVSAVMAQCSLRKKKKILSVLISFLPKLKRARDPWTNLHGQG